MAVDSFFFFFVAEKSRVRLSARRCIAAVFFPSTVSGFGLSLR